LVVYSVPHRFVHLCTGRWQLHIYTLVHAYRVRLSAPYAKDFSAVKHWILADAYIVGLTPLLRVARDYLLEKIKMWRSFEAWRQANLGDQRFDFLLKCCFTYITVHINMC